MDITAQFSLPGVWNQTESALKHYEDAVIITKSDLSVHFWSEDAARLLGWREDEVKGRNISELLKIKPIDSIIKKNVVVFDEEAEDKFGSKKRLRFWVRVHRHPASDVKGIAITLREPEKDLSYKTGILESYDSGDRGCVLMRVISGEDGLLKDIEYLQVNESAKNIFGYDFTGGKLSNVMTGDQEFWLETYKKADSSGVVTSFETYSKNTQKWLNIQIIPLRSGKRHHLICIVDDITDKKVRIQDSDFFSQLIFELLNVTEADSIMIKTDSMLCSYLNAGSCMFLEREDESNAKLYYRVVDSYTSTTVGNRNKYITEAQSEGLREGNPLIVSDTSKDIRVKHKEFSSAGIGSFIAVPAHTAGQMKFAVMIASQAPREWQQHEIDLDRDIGTFLFPRLERARVAAALASSERKYREMCEKLTEEDHNKNRFISMISHELRNPLASLVAGAALLENHGMPDEHSRKALESVKRQANNMSHLIEDLLDLTRINNNKIKLKKSSFELTQFVKDVAADHRDIFAARDINLVSDVSRLLINVEADITRLTQVMGNLLHNASKFTKSGDIIAMTVDYDQASNEAVLKICDTGTGISHEHLAYIFDPFYQADNSLDRKSGGLGLGLSISKGIIDLHGGTITASSGGIGHGTCFTIRLPAIGAEAADPAATTSPSSAPAASGAERLTPISAHKHHRILLIEDNRDLASIMNDYLSSFGYEVASANTARAGHELALTFAPHVILSDIGLPDMNGYELAAAMRREKKLSDVYLIALSGYASSDDIEKAMLAGFNRHLAKPLDIDILLKVLQNEIS